MAVDMLRSLPEAITAPVESVPVEMSDVSMYERARQLRREATERAREQARMKQEMAHSHLVEKGYGTFEKDIFTITPEGKRIQKVILFRQQLDNDADPNVAFSMNDRTRIEFQEHYLAHGLGLPLSLSARQEMLGSLSEAFQDARGFLDL